MTAPVAVPSRTGRPLRAEERSRGRPVLAALRNPGTVLLLAVAIGWVRVAPDYLVFTINAAVPVAVAALGLLVLQGWAREISLATAGLFAISLYYFGWLNRPDSDGLGIPWVPAALIAVGIATVLMGVLALASSRLPGIYLVILTLGLQGAIERTVFPIGKLSGGISGGGGDGEPIVNPRPWFFGLDLSSDEAFYLFSLGWLALVLVLLVRLRHSPTGLALLLVGADRQAAAAVGISPLRHRVLAFTVSGLLAGVGGVLACWLYVSPPIALNYGATASLLLLAIPVLAGVDSIAGVLVIATAFTAVPVVLESWRINSFLLAAIGLGLGAACGSRGVGGLSADLIRRIRHGDRTARTRRVGGPAAATAALRASTGLAGDAARSGAGDAARREALAVVEAWLPPRPSAPTALRAEGIQVALGGVRAVDGVDITVPTGAMVGLIGPNGAGKTTLFDVISGLRRPDAGRVELLGRDVSGTTAWTRAAHGMSRTFQSTRVITDLSVADNLLAGAYQRITAHPVSFLVGSPRAWEQRRAAERTAAAAARLLDIDRYLHERVGTLEFSARRRVEIGRALLAGPRLLLLDEPAAGLDPASSTALFALIDALHTDLGLTVLLVEHYVRAVLQSCDLVYVLAEGKVLAAGTPAEVAADPEVQSRYLGTRVRNIASVTTKRA